MARDIEDDTSEVVDEIADDLNTERIQREAQRLGISEEELLDRVVVEAKARLS